MKKLILLGLVIAISFALIACGGGSEDEISPASGTDATGEIFSVIEKYEALLAIVDYAEAAIIENGWDQAPDYDADLGASLDMVQDMLFTSGIQLENSADLTVEELIGMEEAFDRLIPVWQETLDKVSQPYVAE
jgi:hypothetical protein